jgi:hypothetical protein
MQGGITSGVVYPAAVLALKDSYHFVNIGGASAGAIAAAVTAAAELGRARGSDGFGRLAEVSAQLSQPGFLVKLFQPTEATRPLMEMFLAVLRGIHRKSGRAFWIGLYTFVTAWRLLTGAVVVGAAAALAVYAAIVWLTRGELGGRGLILALALVLAGMLVGALVALLRVVLREVPRNGFGMARGLHTGTEPALTEWLTAALDQIAGLGDGEGPLTFGMLAAKGITLRAITTNLSQQRPYRVPFESYRFAFSAAEMHEYFPPAVVQHLVKHAEPSRRVTLPDGFHFLPAADDLPVVVATRLSLSFPMLVSALPLYTFRIAGQPTTNEPRAIRSDELRRCWFSDGGICSNFPIHFFDDWVPGHPTFGISLITGEVEEVHNVRDVAPPAAGTRDPHVHLPLPNRPEPATWKAIGGIPEFLGSVVGTALDYRDTLQRELPSYRERVVQIGLSADEGGLNLDMPPERVQMLVARGRAAGERLGEFDFQQHLWVRLRVLIPRLVEQLGRIVERTEAGLLDLPALSAALRGRDFPYPRDEEWVRQAQALLNALGAASQHLSKSDSEADEPRPPSVMRVTPPV